MTDAPDQAQPALDPPSPASATLAARPRPPWSVVAVALAIAVVSLGVAATALLVRTSGSDDDALRRSALEAARERTVTLTTYDHRRLDEDFAAVLDTATGDFEADYRSTTGQLRGTFVQTKAVAEGEVVAAGLESLEDPDDGPLRAVAVVAVDQVITTAGAAPRTERNRLRMELVRPDDRWLVSRVRRL